MIDAQGLIAFEDDIAREIEAGKIHAPVHLSKGNEQELISIFKHIYPDDWVFSTHRSHYHALLKGVPSDLVKSEIMAGHSITLNFKEYSFFSSAIVGGILPIALGVAMGGQRAWAFVGDMAAETGIFHECVKYAHAHKLPIKFVVEDNGLSVNTPTDDIWGYSYKRRFPHQGSGKWVTF
jgi:pyruvate dehydrogenase E1 component alpha subunit